MAKCRGRFLKKGLSGFALMASFWACSSRDWTLLGERDVRRLLPRYAMLAAGIENRGEPDSIRQAAYRQFFEAEGYTLRDWDSSMMWYAKHNIPLYYDFYRLAGMNLGKEADILQLRVDSISRAEEYRRKRMGYDIDSINLLQIGVAYYYSGELLNTSFSIQPSTPYTDAEGILSVSLSGLPKLNGDKALDLELRFYAQDSTLQLEHRAIKASGNYSINLPIADSKPIVRISGHLRGVIPRLKKGSFVFVDSVRFIRYPKGSKEDETVGSPEPLTEPTLDEQVPIEESL